MRRREFAKLVAATLLWPMAANAEKPMPVIGILGVVSLPPSFTASFRQGLSETGYVEGQSVAIEFRWSEGRSDRLSALVADLIARKVDVIVTTGGTPPALAAKSATSTVPIVFVTGADPVAAGLVASLAHPGENLTGTTFQSTELMTKRIELLSELVPSVTVMALLVNPNASDSIIQPLIRDTQDAAHGRGVQFQVLKAGTENEIDVAFASLAHFKVGALLVSPDGYFPTRREQLAALASRHAVPVMYSVREYVDAGGLISYGSTLTGTARQVGIYVGKILMGAKPADLPV